MGQSETSVPKTENEPFNTSSPYSASKAAQECICMSYFHSYKLPIIITRSSNIYGINQFPEKLIPKFICHMIDNKKCPIQGDGSNKRLFLHVLDLCEALEIVIQKGTIGESYNIAADFSNEYTVMDIANMIITYFGGHVDDNITFIHDRNFNDKRYYMSCEKLKALGWTPKHIDFENELKIIIEWYKINRHRYQL
jgi:dTDP-D-glucose 4,6-dehydratase